jgi:hypothetical protein
MFIASLRFFRPEACLLNKSSSLKDAAKLELLLSIPASEASFWFLKENKNYATKTAR